MGTPRTWARVFAVAMPTRIPVNSPGPIPTAIPAMPESLRSAQDRSCWMVGTTISWPACRGASTAEATGPFSVPKAIDVVGVEVSMPRTSTLASGVGPGGGHLEQPVPPAQPRRPARRHEDPATIILVWDRQLGLHVVLGKKSLDGVAPLHHHQGLFVQHLLETEIQHVLDPVQAIHVQMVDRNGAAVF